jgi:UDP-3-O-[3-hydroxymyristoyl] glucosamine N-acyltransferase
LWVRVAKPDRAFERLVELFRPASTRPAPGVHASAVIASDANLGDGVAIGPLVHVASGAKVGSRTVLHAGVVLGADASVGDDCEIHANAVIGPRVVVGSRVTVHSNVVLGADGFGFRPGARGLEKLEHIGTVIVEDDVEIGAGTTIDRARFGRTRIGRGTKIDNLVQIAHNVQVGAHCVIAAQTGISGSTIIGDRCSLGGQVGTVPHVKIGDGCMIAARAGISKDTAPGSVVYGFIAGPHLAKKREEAAARHLPALLKRVRELERRLGIDSGSAEERT